MQRDERDIVNRINSIIRKNTEWDRTFIEEVSEKQQDDEEVYVSDESIINLGDYR